MEQNLEQQVKEAIMKHRIEKAKTMGLEEEVIVFLKKIKEEGDWQRLEWFYLCAIDRMPLAELKRLEEAKYTIPQIRKERMDFLKRVCLGLEPVYRTVEQLKSDVHTACQESKQTKTLLEKNLKQVLDEQRKLAGEAIRSKEEAFQLLKEKLREVTDEKEQLEVELENLREQFSKQTEEFVPNFGTNESEEEHMEQPGFFTEMLKKFTKKKKEDDVKRMIDTFLKNEKYTEEQKNFFIDCLEEGYSFEEVQSFVSENLSLSVMKRLKKLRLEKQKKNG